MSKKMAITIKAQAMGLVKKIPKLPWESKSD
jgi:hypothetical protein